MAREGNNIKDENPAVKARFCFNGGDKPKVSQPGPTGPGRGGMTSSDPPDFNHINLGLWQETVLGATHVFSLLALNNKPFLLSISGLGVLFGLTSTMRQTQVFRRHPHYSSHFGGSLVTTTHSGYS